MTFLAGAFSLSGSLRDAEGVFESMSRSLSRHAADTVYSVRDDRVMLLKVDIGAFSVAAQIDDGSAVTLVAGEPVIPRADGGPRDRMSDTHALHASLGNGDSTALKSARGLFSVARYDRATGSLIIATDRLGLRPIYYARQGDMVIFSSALRVLENLALVDKQIDMNGLSQQLTIGYPLAERTLYAGVSLLRTGEMMRCALGSSTLSQYWDWRPIVPREAEPEIASSVAYNEFMNAVRLRLGSDRTVTAFLSGGLDSRCVVAALRSSEVAVHTINLSAPETQDREFGRLLAEAAGTVHEEHLLSRERDPVWSFTMASILQLNGAPIAASVERPRLVWSGDGGSVSVGHVHLTPAIAEYMRAGNDAAAIESYLHADCSALPLRLFTPAFTAGLTANANAAVASELDRLRSRDPAQTFYWFLMQNDQRRFVQSHFEEMDLHRLEFHRPFFDAEFLTAIAQIPVAARLRHAFYVSWLDHFPSYVKSTPWQAYPHHAPCLVPSPRRLAYQWTDASAEALAKAVRKDMLRKAQATLADPDFASPAIRRIPLALAMLAHWSGRRDYRYVVRAAETVQRLWRITGGRFNRSA